MADEDYLAFVRPFLATVYDLTNKSEGWLEMLMLIFKKELQYGQEIVQLAQPFFVASTSLNSETLAMLKSLPGDRQ